MLLSNLVSHEYEINNVLVLDISYMKQLFYMS